MHISISVCFYFCILQLLDALKNVTFIDEGNSFHFDAHGDMNTGYDVVLWKEIDGHLAITKIAQYDLKNDVFIITDQETKNEFSNLKVILWQVAVYHSHQISTLITKVLDPTRTSSDPTAC